MLGGFGLLLAGACDIRHQSDVYEQTVVPALFAADLADCLDKGLGLYVAYRAADLGHHDVGVGLDAHGVYEVLYFSRDVRYRLYGLPEIFAFALLVQHVPEHFSRSQVGILVQVLVDESFVMPEIEVGFGAVLGNEHFAVLIRAHGSRVYVYIRVEFLSGDFQSPRFQQSAKRRHDYAFPQPRHHAARYENVLDDLRHFFSPLFILILIYPEYSRGDLGFGNASVHRLAFDKSVSLGFGHVQLTYQKRFRPADGARFVEF